MNGGIGTTAENLMLAAQGENYESENMYADFARTAREEGFDEIAFCLKVSEELKISMTNATGSWQKTLKMELCSKKREKSLGYA